jgi:dihydroorotase-like cyclic amidohydrolase
LGDVLIENDLIVEISESISAKSSECVIIDAENYLMPGAIDDQVHFRALLTRHSQNPERQLPESLLYRAIIQFQMR